MIIKNISNWFAKLNEYALLAFFVTFPFINYGLYLYTGTTTRAVNFALLTSFLGIITGFLLLKRKTDLVILKSPIILSLVLYFIGVCISGIYGFNFETSFWSNVTRMTGIWFFVNLGVFLFLILSIIENKNSKDRLMQGIIFSTALYSLFSFLGPEGLNWIFKTYNSDGFTFGNSTFAGMYIFGVFILSIYYLFTASKKTWWHYVLPIILVISPTTINTKIFSGDITGGLLGEARASSLVIFIAMFSLFIAWLISKIVNEKLRKNIIISIFTLTIIAIGYAGYSLLTPNGFVREAYLSQATGARPLVWEVSNKVIADAPVLGWGVDNFERVFEKYYDNRLLEDNNGNEAWFDRAHNVFVDQTIDNGFVGLVLYVLVYLVTGICLLFVLLRSKQREDVVLSVFLLIYFGLHLLELQTAFDTIPSFIILAFMFALAVNVFSKTLRELRIEDSFVIKSRAKQVIGILMVIFFAWVSFAGLLPFIRTQNANGLIRTIGYSEKRLEMYDTLFASQIDLPAFLWRTSADLQRGIGENPSILNDAKKTASINKEFEYLAVKYKEHIAKNPNDFRSHLNLADVLMYVRLFENDRLEEAQQVLDRAVLLVPQSPQAYWMKAVAYIYQRKFDLARVWAQKGLELNPQIKESQKIVEYVEDSIKTFPDIELYFFKQT